MKMQVQEYADTLRSLVGDEAITLPDQFIMDSLNWAFRSLPSVPKLYVAWQKHYTFNLDANGHYRFKFKSDFADIIKFDYINFFTSTGGDPCPLNLCYRHNIPFYKKNGVVELKVAGQPCEYTREREGDDFYLVFDRPSNVPIIVDYICYGRPKSVQSMTDEFEAPTCIYNLILSATRRLVYQVGDDFAFAADIAQYLDAKEVAEAVQELNQENSNDSFGILGEPSL